MESNDEKRSAVTMNCICDTVECSRITTGLRELIVEAPLSITVAGQPEVTLMYTPGDEISLAVGYLFTQGRLQSMGDIDAISFCHEDSGRVVRVTPAQGRDLGVCLNSHGAMFDADCLYTAESIEALATGLRLFEKKRERLSLEAIAELGTFMNSEQRYFFSTGGTHAAVLAQIRNGRVVAGSTILKEDIGRHNALDKAVGEAFRNQVSFSDVLLFLSGRISVEMVLKAARAGISDLAAVSAPTAPAVEIARQLGMLLIGFARGRSAVVYAGRDALAAS